MTQAPKRTARYGTWESPLTPETMTGGSIGMGEVSADGATLLWLESRPEEQGRTVLVRRNADGTIQDLVPAPVNVGSRVHEYGGGAYAASDGRIVFSDKTDNAVWLISADAAPRKIAAVAGCRYADFRFVPGSDSIVCVREDHRGRPATNPEAGIVLLDLTSAVPPETHAGLPLVLGADFYAAPRPSPDGQHLAFLSWNHPDMPWDATQLHVARLLPAALGTIATVAGHDRREAAIQPEWSPSGILHFCTDRSGWWNIHRLRDDGTIEPATALPDGEIGGPLWNFGQRYFAFLPDGSIVAALSRGGRVRAVTLDAGQVGAVDGDGGTIHDLPLPSVQQCPVVTIGPQGAPLLAYIATAADKPPTLVLGTEAVRTSGPERLTPDDISIAQSIVFPTADGEPAYAFYYPPKNARFAAPNAEKPPLIVTIHGGPTSMARPGFSLSVQWWTTRGFAVVDVDYRGSTGYGRSYRRKLDGQWGVADVEDCIAAVAHLVAEGLADPDRVAIRGGSAGGFTALAALVASPIFKAGASLYGIGDLMLLAQETHKFESRYMDRLVGPLPESAAVYAARSPIHRLDRMTAGAIFFQGLDDKVVPPSQAETMVAAMRARGLPVAHYTFEGEGHGFRKATTQRRVLDLELGFYGRLFGFAPPGLAETVAILSDTDISPPPGIRP